MESEIKGVCPYDSFYTHTSFFVIRERIFLGFPVVLMFSHSALTPENERFKIVIGGIMVAVYTSADTGFKPATCHQPTDLGQLLPECGNHFGGGENLQKKCYVTKYQPIYINAKKTWSLGLRLTISGLFGFNQPR